MRRRIYFAAVILISFASVAMATFVAIQKIKPTAKPTTQKSSTNTAGQKATAPTGAANRTGTTAANAPIRPADPNRAPQKLLDDALYTNEDFFGVNASVARPYVTALERVSALESQYPKDAKLRLHSARLAERTGQFDKAAVEMTQYADLTGTRKSATSHGTRPCLQSCSRACAFLCAKRI
jgi:hypothetical protein